jgi:AcrR family transcriptional regulator
VREAIMKATLELLREHGLARLSTPEIAKRARVAEGSIYYHFGDKVGLLEAVLVAALEPVFEFDTDAVAASPERTLADGLLGLGRALEAFLGQALPVLETIQSDPKLRAAFSRRLAAEDRGPHRGTQQIERYLEAARAARLVDPEADLTVAATLLHGACFLRSWNRHLMGSRRTSKLPPLERLAEALAAMLAPREAPA